MANNEVRAHIEVTTNIQEIIKEIVNESKRINNSIESALANPMNNTLSSVEALKISMNELVEKCLSLDGKIPEHTFDGMTNILTDMINKLNNVKVLTGDVASEYTNIANTSSNININTDNFNEQMEDIADTVENTGEAMEDLGDSSEQAGEGFNFAVIDGEKLVTTLKSLLMNGNLTSGSIMQIVKSLGPYGVAIMAVVSAYNALDKVMDSFIADAKAAGGFVSDLLIDSYEDFISTCEELADKVQYLNDKLLEAVEVGAVSQEGYFTLFNYLGEEAGEEIVAFTDKLEKLYNMDASSLVGDMRGMLAVVSNMNLGAEDITKYAKSLTLFTQDLAAFSGNSREEITGQLEAAINMNVLNSRSALARALDLTDKEIKQFKSLNTQEERAQYLLTKGVSIRGTYNKYLQTSAGKVEQLNEQYSSLINNVGRFALGLYAKVAPLLTKLINLANTLVTSLAKVFGIDLKESSANMAEGTGLISSGLEEVAESADKAERKLGDFDDVIQINDSKSSGNSGAGAFDIGDMDWSAWLDDIDDANDELSEFDKMLEKVKEHMENGEFYEAGQTIISFFKDFLNDVDWDDIQGKASEFGIGLAQFLNGLLSDSEAYKAIGKTLAEALNTGLIFLFDFAKEFDFKQLGVALEHAWRGFWENLDTKLFGQVIYEWVHGAFESGSTLINNLINGKSAILDEETGKIELFNGFELMGKKLADSVNEFFSNLTEEDIQNMADTLLGIIEGVFSTLCTLMDKLDTEDIKEKLLTIIKKIITGLNENAEEWGTIAGELISGLLDFASEALETADTSGLSSAISTFLEKMDIGGIIGQWMGLKFDVWVMEMKAILPAKLEALGAILASALGVIIGSILGFLVAGITSAVDIIWSVLKTLGDLVVALVQVIGIGLTLAGQAIDKGLNSAGQAIDNWLIGVQESWSGIKEKVETFFSEFWEKIGSFFDADKWKKIAKDAFNGLWEGLKSIWQSIKNWWNTSVAKDISFTTPSWLGGKPVSISIPKLAKGGIAKQATLAVVGEAGDEAVLPLKNNTDWMDTLATKIAGMLNNGKTSSSTINLDMSSISKPYYSRSEMLEFGKTIAEALKLYGVKVSIAY